MLKKNFLYEINNKINVADIFVGISLLFEVILCIIQSFSINETVNVLLFINVYILFFAIACYFIIVGINKHFLVFAFFFCFFIFLLGQKIFKYMETGGYDEFLTFSFLKLDASKYFVFTRLMYGALISVFIGYRISFRKYFKRRNNEIIKNRFVSSQQLNHLATARKVLMVLLIVCFLCSLYMQTKIVAVKSDMTYTEGYLVNVDVNPVIKIGNFLFIGFVFLYLCCRPKLSQVFVVLLMFLVVEGGLQVLIGRRALIAKALLFIVWYVIMCCRYDREKMPYTYFVFLGLFAVLVMVVFWFIEQARSDSNDSFSLFGALKDFMVSTGGSDSVVANTIDKQDVFPKSGIVYLLYPLKQALFNNVAVQQIKSVLFGISTPDLAQGLEYVQANDLFSHWISYLVNQELYVNGYGMGTSFIAELFIAFGVIGVVIGGLLLGKAIAYMSAVNINGMSIEKNAIILYLAYNLFTLPRSGLFDTATNILYFICAVLIFRVIGFILGFRGVRIWETTNSSQKIQ